MSDKSIRNDKDPVSKPDPNHAPEHPTEQGPEHDAVLHLMERYVSEQISDSECEQLNRIIETNSYYKDYLRQQLNTHSLLQESLTDGGNESSVSGIMGWCALRAFATTGPYDSNDPTEKSRTIRPVLHKTDKKKSSFLAVGLVLLVLFLASLAVYSEFFSRNTVMQSPQTFARIVETIDVDWGEGNPALKPGAKIANEIIKFEQGLVKLEFVNGAELILEGPAELIVSGRLRTFCRQGKINAYVPKSARNFELTTPFSRIVDLGTEFSAVINEEATEVHMIEGKVEISRDRNNVLPLTEGQAVLIPKNGDTETVPLNRETCVRAESFAKLLAAFFEKRAKIRERQNAHFVQNPDLLCRFDGSAFSGSGKGRLYNGRKIRLSDSDRDATRFQSRRDGIELEIPGKQESLTLLMMVRVHMLTHVSRLLIDNDYYDKPGAILWQLDRSGEIQFRINSNRTKEFVAFDVRNVFHPLDWGTWCLFAVTLDAEQRVVKHYKDGLLVGELPWKNPEPIRLDHVSVGNESRNHAKQVDRFLNADIAEMQIYRRALTEEEIREIYVNLF